MVRQHGLSLIICILVCWTSALSEAQQQTLFSENTASLYIGQASGIYAADPLDPQRIEQAMIFLEAAYLLDANNQSIPEQMLRLGQSSCYVGPDYSNNLMWALDQYLSPRSDLEVASGAIRCMLERLQSRVDREVFLEKLIRQYNGTNAAFVSDVATQLGLLVAEKSDIPTAMNYLATAYQLNPYNQLAYSKIQELSAAQENVIPESTQIAHLRRTLAMNPYDLGVAIAYGDALQQFQIYDLAAGAYEYASKVHKFLYPNRPLAKEILHPWLLSCYHSNRMAAKCLTVAEMYRDAERLDLVLEAAVGKTQIQMGQVEAGKRTLETAAQRAETLLSADNASVTVQPEDLAWFYSFILESPDKALAWSNQAFEQDPNRPAAQIYFAYTLAINEQYELAQQYAQPYKDVDQTALLTSAVVQLSEDRKQEALESLKSVVEMGPETFVAEKALKLLDTHESSFIPSVSPDTIREELENQYRFGLIPEFQKPSERYSVKLLFSGSDFLYGSDFSSRLVIENTSSDPLIISDQAMLKGRLHVDAVLEGNLNITIKDLLLTQFRPSNPIVPGGHYSLPLDLYRGRLKKILLTYPQADVSIRFQATLDPEPAPMGDDLPTNAAATFQGRIHRRGVALSRHFLMQRLDVLSKGQPGQKYRAASLFTGLLAEQTALNLSRSAFEHVQVEPVLLTDAVRKILRDPDWRIRVQALDALASLSVPLDAGLIRAVSDNLNHDKWPVRMTAMFLLAQAQPDAFQKVLDWTAQHDAAVPNRQMAIALGAAKPEQIDDKTALKTQE